EVHGVVGPQLGRREPLRIVQGHHGPEGEDSEEGRQDSTPPARAEPRGRVVAEDLVDLLFEHRCPSLSPDTIKRACPPCPERMLRNAEKTLSELSDARVSERPVCASVSARMG